MIYIIALLVLLPSVILALALCRMAARFAQSEPGHAFRNQSTVVRLSTDTADRREEAA